MSIDSPKNARVREWRELQTRRGRRVAGLFLVEGPHLVGDALASGADVRELILEAERESSPEFRSFDGKRTVVTRRVMESLSETETPQGVAAVVALPGEGHVRPRRGRFLLLDGVQDPGNVGTMVRTADAAGLDGVVLGNGCADVYGAKAVRATQGSIFHLPVAFAPVEEWIAGLRAEGVPIYGSGLGESTVDYRDVRGGDAFGLVMGSEGAGVRSEVLAACDAVLRIPMRGRAESLGVAIAAGVLLFRLAE